MMANNSYKIYIEGEPADCVGCHNDNEHLDHLKKVEIKNHECPCRKEKKSQYTFEAIETNVNCV